MEYNPVKHTRPAAGHAPVDRDSSPAPSYIDPSVDKVNAGDATILPDDAQVLLTLDADRFVAIHFTGEPEYCSELADMLLEAVEAVHTFQPVRLLSNPNVDLVVSVQMGGLIGDGRELAVMALKSLLEFLENPGIDQAVELATKKGIWNFKFDDFFSVMLVSSLLKKVFEQYGTVCQTLESIEAERKKCLHAEAEPLLDELDEQLCNSSLVAAFREELVRLREDLVRKAYYQGIIETSEVAEELRVVEEIVRRYARNGRLGLALSRHYVFSRDEVRRFVAQDRPRGKHRTKREI